MRYAALSLTANTLGSIALFFLFRALGLMPHLGIAVATTLGGWLNAGLLYAHAGRGAAISWPTRACERALPLIVLASLVMGAALWLAAAIARSPGSRRRAACWSRHGALAALVGAGLARLCRRRPGCSASSTCASCAACCGAPGRPA